MYAKVKTVCINILSKDLNGRNEESLILYLIILLSLMRFLILLGVELAGGTYVNHS